MPLVSGPPNVFTQAWVDGLKRVPEAGMAAEVEIYTLGERVYNEATNKYDYLKTVLYAGKARVQPLRSATPRIMPNNTTSVQTVLISLPIDALKDEDIRPSVQVRVRNAPLNPSLLMYQYVVKEIVDSSNPLERTILTEVNQEAVA